MPIRMSDPFNVRSVVASLTLALLAMPGCSDNTQEQPGRTPPNPAAPADRSRPVDPNLSGVGKEAARVESDLHKDLGGGPIIKPDAKSQAGPVQGPGTP